MCIKYIRFLTVKISRSLATKDGITMNDIIKRRFAAVIAAVSLLSTASCGNVVERVETDRTIETLSPDSISEEENADSATTTATTTAATTTAETTTTTTVPAIMKGNLYDTSGTLLMYSEKDADGKEQRMTNDSNKVAFANVLNEMSEGLDKKFEDILRTKNPNPVNGDEKVGQSIQLTFDAAKQNAVYDYMAQTNLIGSAVVMRSDGSIAAQVSYPSYNPDDYYGVKTEEDLAWGTYGNKAFQNAEPGSCFKIMSEVISDKHGITSLTDEGTWEYDGTSIVNWDHENTWCYPVQRTLYSAFVNSSNIYFARSFDQIGKDDVLADLDNIFHFVSDIDCDFGTIHNNVEIYCNDDLRRTAFGQAYVLTCPVYLAALGREAAFGDMVKPFVIKNTVDTTDFSSVTKAGSTPNEVIASIPAEYRQNLLDGMTGVGSNIGIGVPAGYSFYAKTGTAETWQGDFLYITGVVKRDGDDGSASYADYSTYDGSYIIIMQIRNAKYFNFDFASQSASIYQGLINTVLA